MKLRVLLLSLLLSTAWAWGRALPPTGLRVEYLDHPMGMDVRDPRFYWLPQNTERGASTVAYQVIVSTDAKAVTGDVWDSQRVVSPEFVHIVYAGKPLESNRTYYWKVRYWDAQGPSDYSEVARFDTGLFNASDWKGHWIKAPVNTGGTILRKEFTLASAPVRARAFVAGVGYYEMQLNGHKVGNHVLDSAYTAYAKRILYSTYDVTTQLKAGPNAVALLLGEGWYDGRAAIMQIEVEMAGGQKATIVSDGSWKSTTDGPLESDSIYDGEVYDARKEMPGYNRAGFNDAAWKSALVDDAGKGVLSAQMMPPIRVVGEMAATKMSKPRPGVYVYDLGQNFSGWVKLQVKGPAGTRVKIRHAELLYPDGTINVENLRSARATDVYVLKGSGEMETYEPRFTYHGFRYVELTGFPGTPTLMSIRAQIVNSDVKAIGSFSTSKDVLNGLQRIIFWGTRSNLHSVPTDCNQRDERMGWMADAHLAAETAMFNFDMAAFYTNFLRDMKDSQEDDGSVPDTVPRARFARGPADPAWGAAYPLIVEYMYKHYGDKRILEQHYDGIKKWTDWQGTKAENHILKFHKFGDWVPIQQTPGFLVSTVYYYLSADLTSKTASLLGKKEDAGKYRDLAATIRDAFNKTYYDASKGVYGNGSQGSQVLPLFFGMVPDNLRGGVFGKLRHDILYERDTHLSTGILATKYLFPVLAMNGNADLAYDVATQTTYPSYGYMLSQGATTIWELWQEKTGPSMNSHNHPMFGSVGAWLYEGIGGIGMKSPGYAELNLKPLALRDLQYASASTETVRGPVATAWSRTATSFDLSVDVPVGVTANVTLPKANLRNISVKESGAVVFANGAYQQGAAGVTAARDEGSNIVFTVGSGHYSFALSGE